MSNELEEGKQRTATEVIETEKVNVRMTAQRMKQHFLETAEPLIDQYIGAALGVADFTSVNASAREECWDVLKKLMLQSSDKLELDIASAEDVLKAVSSGKCTFEEGEKLLSLYKKVKDIETTGMLQDTGGLTINILNTQQEALEGPNVHVDDIHLEPMAINVTEKVKMVNGLAIKVDEDGQT